MVAITLNLMVQFLSLQIKLPLEQRKLLISRGKFSIDNTWLLCSDDAIFHQFLGLNRFKNCTDDAIFFIF